MIARYTTPAKWFTSVGLLIQISAAAIIPLSGADKGNTLGLEVNLAIFVGQAIGTLVLGLGLSHFAQAKGYPKWYGVTGLLSWLGLLFIALLRDRTVRATSICCSECGYDRTGLSELTACPECGCSAT